MTTTGTISARSVTDQRSISFLLDDGWPLLVNDLYMDQPIRVSGVKAEALRLTQETGWSLVSVDVTGKHVADDGTLIDMTTRRTFHAGQGYVYAIENMPAWLAELVATELNREPGEQADGG